jgi:hypothetical protein
MTDFTYDVIREQSVQCVQRHCFLALKYVQEGDDIRGSMQTWPVHANVFHAYKHLMNDMAPRQQQNHNRMSRSRGMLDVDGAGGNVCVGLMIPFQPSSMAFVEVNSCIAS